MKLIDPNVVKQLFNYDACISIDTDADKDYVRELIDAIPTIDAEPVVRCKNCKHRFLEIIEGKKVFSCLYRMGTLDLNGYCDCGAMMDEVTE